MFEIRPSFMRRSQWFQGHLDEEQAVFDLVQEDIKEFLVVLKEVTVVLQGLAKNSEKVGLE